MTARALVVVVVLAGGSLSRAAEVEETPAAAAARKRQEAVKSLEVRVRFTHVYQRGGMAGGRPDPDSSRPIIPREMTTLEGVVRFVSAGDRARLEHQEPMWSSPDKQFLLQPQVHVQDRSGMRSLWPQGFLGNGPARGVIRPTDRLRGTLSARLGPIVLTFRALEPDLNEDRITVWVRTGKTVMIGDAPCEEYTETYGSSVAHFWVDPARGQVVRRIMRVGKEGLSSACDIDYRQDKDGRWVPKSWLTTRYFTDGTVSQTTQAEVVVLRVNAAIPDAEFDLKFPPGCEVAEADGSKQYRVEEDGTLRAVEETPAPQGRRPPQTNYWDYGWVLAAVALVCLAIPVGAWWRRRQSI